MFLGWSVRSTDKSARLDNITYNLGIKGPVTWIVTHKDGVNRCLGKVDRLYLFCKYWVILKWM